MQGGGAYINMLDILIKNGLIADGSGSPLRAGDVGIKDGKIAVLSDHISDPAKETIDAAMKIVAPGFIDMHSHSDLMMVNDATGEEKLRQGVTTEIFGNCGFSPAPVSNAYLESLQAYSEPIMGCLKDGWSWKSYGEYLDVLKGNQFGHNIGGYVGNGALRIAVKGFEAGSLTPEEMMKVKKLLEESLEAGALGLSMGLMYVPENYYIRDELVEICSVLKKYGAILATHMRGEGNSLLKSIEEVLYVARKSEVPLHISHLKAAGRNNWGANCNKAIQLIEDARSSGMDVTCDVYPYTAGSTSLYTLLPQWTLEGGIQKAIKRINDSEQRQKILDELNRETNDWDNLVYSTGWESVMISSVNTAANQRFVGKRISEIAQSLHVEPAEAALNLLAEEDGKVAIVFFHMSEEDVIKIMRLDYSLVISDSLYSKGGMPHPRRYGAFPRLFAKYVREKKILSPEEAVKKVTLLPAQRLGLKQTGRIENGYNADIVVFDINTIQDNATYINPKQLSAGIDYVIVGGKVACRSDKLTGIRNGKLLLRK